MTPTNLTIGWPCPVNCYSMCPQLPLRKEKEYISLCTQYRVHVLLSHTTTVLASIGLISFQAYNLRLSSSSHVPAHANLDTSITLVWLSRRHLALLLTSCARSGHVLPILVPHQQAALLPLLAGHKGATPKGPTRTIPHHFAPCVRIVKDAPGSSEESAFTDATTPMLARAPRISPAGK